MKLTYEELKEEIRDAPITWLPALFVEIVKACEERVVFQPGAMERFINRSETKGNKV